MAKRKSKGLGLLWVLGLCLLGACRAGEATDSNKHPHPERLKVVSDQPLKALLPPGYLTQKISLYVNKKGYFLSVLYDQKPLKTYPVVFGFGYGPDKRQEGDGATPEGLFKVKDLYAHPDWDKFIWINYPTAESKKRFQAAKARGKIPPNATIGGEIGIHGVPGNNSDLITQQKNWTAGCVSLKNADVNEIYAVIQKGTVVQID